MTRTCGFCGEGLDGGGGRLCQLDLCSNCWHGDPGGRAALRGFSIMYDCVLRRSTNTRGGSRSFYQTTVSGLLPHDLELCATFSREGIGSRLRKLFRKEVQAGDPLFDATVFVDAPPSPALAELVENPGVQDAVLEVLSFGGTLALNRLEARATVRSEAPPDEAALRRAILLTLHHLDRHLAALALAD